MDGKLLLVSNTKDLKPDEAVSRLCVAAHSMDLSYDQHRPVMLLGQFIEANPTNWTAIKLPVASVT